MELQNTNELTPEQMEELEKQMMEQQEYISRIPELDERIRTLEETHLESNFGKLLELYKAENLILKHNQNHLIRIQKNLSQILKSVKILSPYINSEAGKKIQESIEELKDLK